MAESYDSIKAVQDDLKIFFTPAPPIGCGNGRDDHECDTCRETYRKHDER